MRLLVCDYDGTLFTNEESIKKNAEKIYDWMKKGDLFMISTGRSFNSIAEKLIKYHIPVDYIATEDGSHLFDRNSNLLHEKLLDRKIIKKLDSIIDLGIHEELQFGTKFEYYNKIPEGINNISSINFVLKKDKVNNDFIREWKKVELCTDYSYLVYGYGDEVYYCIKPKSVDKTTPIKFLEIDLPILKKNIYTIGDSDNDKSMVNYYNGYVIGKDNPLGKFSNDTYNEVYEVINDINKKLVKKRWN